MITDKRTLAKENIALYLNESLILVLDGIPLDFKKLTGFEAIRQTSIIFHTHNIKY